MSKSVMEMMHEIESYQVIDNVFNLYVLSLKLDSYGEIISTESTNAVNNVEIDNEHKEVLLHINTKNDKSLVSVSDVKSIINNSIFDYKICIAEETTLEDSSFVRIDTPLIGFGENIEKKQFFAVCQHSD